MEYTPNPELERLKAEKEKNEKEIEQLTHKITRLENRQKYFEDGERKRRTHRLCTIAGTLESIAPEVKELDITEVMEFPVWCTAPTAVKSCTTEQPTTASVRERSSIVRFIGNTRTSAERTSSVSPYWSEWC